ncbi:unnamed protein product [Phytophthora lilii]|uniref:Unnamed protein product n=1 Tax=Phytophthora lilii TaxID=2077276 RepID=A0A9W6X565_9STRA|nr:unnamed protein product [Phytophthora lilii]
MIFKELSVSSTIPEAKLKRAFKTGTLSLFKDDLSKAELHYIYTRISKVWGGIKSAFKIAKNSGLLSRAADLAVPALAKYAGQPASAIPARAAIRSMTGIGVYDSDSDKEGGRLTMADVKKGVKRALSYAKRKGVLTDVVDSGEKFLLSKATKPEHEILIKSIRGEVRRRYGVGIERGSDVGRVLRPHQSVSEPTGKKFVKGSQEAKDHMAKIRAMRKSGGSFRL